jgi:protein archease
VTRRGYRFLPHTADLRIEVRGKDLPELYASCVETLFSLLTDRRRVREAGSRALTIEGASSEDRLFFLLRKALLLFDVDRFLVRRAHGRIQGNHVTVSVLGEPLDFSRHSLEREIKAVTRHAMRVEEQPVGFVAHFVVDV